MRRGMVWKSRAAAGTALALAMATVASAQISEEPPTWTTAAICRPTFETSQGELNAGTGFLLKAPGRANVVWLITAQHLFGPGGGLDKDIAWDRMSDDVSASVCTTFIGKGRWTTGAPVEIREASALKDTGAARDIAAFPVDLSAQDAAPSQIFRLADKAPDIGDPVWLVAQLIRGAPPNQLLHRALVGKVGQGLMIIVYDNPDLEIQATSGAPVVNARDEVVGLNYGGGAAKSGDMLGMVQDLDSVRAGLAAIEEP